MDNSKGAAVWTLENHPVISSPLLIGVTGGTASGKTTVCENIMKRLPQQHAVLIAMDSFYKSLPEDEDPLEYNFDHPRAFDWECFHDSLLALKRGEAVDIPTYSFLTHSRGEETIHIEAVDIVIVEGILTFFDPKITKLFNLKIFVDTDSDTRLIRRVRRDMATRGRSLESVFQQYEKSVKSSFENYILPTKIYADIVMPRGAENLTAISLMVTHITGILRVKIEEENKKQAAIDNQKKNGKKNGSRPGDRIMSV